MCVKNIFILYIILFYCSPSIYLSIIKFNFAWKTIFCSPTCRARHDGSPRGPSSSGWTLRKREDKYCSESHVTDELVIFASTYGMYRCQCEDSPVCVCVCGGGGGGVHDRGLRLLLRSALCISASSSLFSNLIISPPLCWLGSAFPSSSSCLAAFSKLPQLPFHKSSEPGVTDSGLTEDLV